MSDTHDQAEIQIEELEGGIRLIRLNRPDRLNALTPDMVGTITESVQVGADHRAVVITGNGRAFSAGVDIDGANKRQTKDRSTADAFAMQERFAAMALAIHRSRVPVIAAVNGPAAGAGLAVTLASDIRIAAPTARFIIGAPNIGLSAGECGISYFLPRLIGLGWAADLMLTNRHVHADEALSLGLVTAIEEDAVTAAIEKARVIAGLAPFGVYQTKRIYRTTVDSSSLEEALELENRAQILANGTEDAREARTAFLEKRIPHFTGR